MLATLDNDKLDVRRRVIAPHAWPTMVHDADGRLELPYRVDLADPRAIARHRPAEILLDETRMDICFQKWDFQAAARVSNAATFLSQQTAGRAIARTGVVVPDELTLEVAEVFLKTTRLPRSRMVLLPWPVAAAWSWLEMHSTAVAVDVPTEDRDNGSILCIQIGSRGFASVSVRVVKCEEKTSWGYAPARNRDQDVLRVCESAVESLVDMLPTLVHESPNCIGIVISGRCLDGYWRAALEGDARSFADQMSLRLACEADFPDGLLARGALVATAVVARGGVPYYETVPRIELIVSKRILEDRPKPLHAIPQSGWLDCLKGVDGSRNIGGGIMIPANRSLVHRPDYPDLGHAAGERKIYVALDQRDVRLVRATITQEQLKRGKDVALQVEYQLGSGRPKITIERASCPDEPIVVEWGSAEECAKTRNEVSSYTVEMLDELHEQRQQLRVKNGMARL